MDLSQLLHLARAAAPYRELLSALERGGLAPVASAREAAWAYLLAALGRDLGRPVLAVAARPGQARDLLEELRAWLGPETPLYLFPERGALPYEDLPPDPGVTQQRLSALAALASLDGGQPCPFIIASVQALMEGTAPRPDFGSGSLTIRVGDRVDRDGLLRQWVDLGYEVQDPVEVPGAMAHRGGILDLYPPQLTGPVRLELYGGRVESLRRFDPATQRSQSLLDSVTIVPARESRRVGTEGCLLDYVPPETLMVQLEPQSLAAEAAALEAQAQESAQARSQADSPLLNPLLPWPDLMGRWDGFPCRLALGAWAGPGAPPAELSLPFSALPPYGGRLKSFFSQARAWLGEKSRVLIASYQAPRLAELLAEEGIFLSSQLEPAAPEPGGLALAPASLPEGWALPLDDGQALRVVTDAELFGLSKRRRPPLRRPVRRLEQALDFAPGDYVVHIDHGIARFGGTALRATEGLEREYLALEYAEGDRLYVPADQVGRVSRYVGAGGYTPALSRLGTQEWARARQRVQASTRDLAKALLETAAAREVAQGRAFAPDAPWQQELESSFPYVETSDQLEAVRAIKKDMEMPQPMDRLVCGDVGYGKTEVALRAAFKAVMDGAQVAVLVPTTVLAQQHLQTFRERLGAFPIRVEALSRFLSEREQALVVAGLADGGVDICIGTHRLLQKDIAFKNLGLVVIDEEQRFGVAHKERLKSMRGAVDVLTLSATPIPRTLHMALAGIKDLSTIETPPEERQPIKTYVSAYEEGRVREAILRELDRGGQVFFIHNRVRHIGWEAAELARLVPEARIAVAHGQMPEEELERVMLDFGQGQTDVLVCTTIIESGLDIPNANTLIVTHADRLGLSQLYQLRGRVGRSAGRAYAYFFYVKGKRLTPAAEQRLRTIFEATELGAGFRIALKDLEIRGAGNLLGAEQSGHIGAVGFTLYTQLLAEAVRELKAAPSPPKPLSLPPPVIDLPLSAYLPPDYVAEMAVRLALYSRMAGLESLEAVAGLREELRDRFGPLPPTVSNLLYLLEVKALAARAGVESLVAQEGELVAQMREGLVWRREAVARLPGAQTSPNQFRLPLGAGRWRETLRRALAVLAAD